MASLCKVTIIGYLGGDPEMRYTPAGKQFTSFSVACSRNYTSAEGERREETEWFRVTAWARLAEICSQYLSKGRQVYVEGRLSTRTWEGPDGQKRFGLDVSANEVQMIDSRPRGDGASGPMGVAAGMGTGMGMAMGGGDDPTDLDSIPF